MNAVPRRRALLSLAVVALATSACGSEVSGGAASPDASAPPAATQQAPAAFTQRAAEVAAAVRASGALTAYGQGLVTLGERVQWGGFTTEAAKEGALGGRALIAIDKGVAPEPATLRFADGSTRVVRLSSAAGAAGEAIAMPCGPTERCALALDAAELVERETLTNRGTVDLPYWEFTGGGLADPLYVLAVAPQDLGGWRTPEVSSWEAPGMQSAMELQAIDGTRITIGLGSGACDADHKGLVREESDVVIVGGSARTTSEVCTANLVITPVRIDLAAPLGNRPLVDAASGRLVLPRGQDGG